MKCEICKGTFYSREAAGEECFAIDFRDSRSDIIVCRGCEQALWTTIEGMQDVANRCECSPHQLIKKPTSENVRFEPYKKGSPEHEAWVNGWFARLLSEPTSLSKDDYGKCYEER